MKASKVTSVYVSHAAFPFWRAKQACHLTTAQHEHTFLDKVGRVGLEMLPGEGLPAGVGGICTALFTFTYHIQTTHKVTKVKLFKWTKVSNHATKHKLVHQFLLVPNSMHRIKPLQTNPPTTTTLYKFKYLIHKIYGL